MLAAIRTHPFGQYDNPVSFAIVEFQVVGSHMECFAAIFSQGANMKAQQPKRTDRANSESERMHFLAKNQRYDEHC